MKQLYAHDALVRMSPRDDPQAIGAAVTVAICGHWEHDPPCPLAPHHTQAEQTAEQVRIRTLFATEPSLESEVRRRIDQALDEGTLRGATGRISSWQVLDSGPGVVAESEREHGERLISS